MAPKKIPYGSLSKSGKYLRDNPSFRKKKKAIDTKINKRPEQMAKRRELEGIRVKAKKKGVDTSSTDFDHAVGKRVPLSKNRGRKNEGGRKRKK